MHLYHPRLILLITLLIAVTGWLLPASAPTHAQDPCAGLVTPRLEPGGYARIMSGYGLSLKNQPMTTAAGASEVALVPFGTAAVVLDGPRCNLGYVWWQVQLPNELTGWAAEGDSADYFLEPYTVGLNVYQVRDGGARIGQFFALPDGTTQPRTVFTIRPRTVTPQEVWPEVDINFLGQALDSVRAICPERLAGTPFEHTATFEDALKLPLPELDYDFFPSPDGDRLVLVRHLHLDVPRCDNVVPDRVGLSEVTLLHADGTEQLLFPFSQYGASPPSEDQYAASEPGAWNVYLDTVLWSPHGRYVAFVAAYRDQCNGAVCYRFHTFVDNLGTQQLYVLGEGRRLAWTNGGEGLNLFRLVSGGENRQVAHLYTMRPDGTDRQEIWLPGGAIFMSDEQIGLGLPWNASGTRVMVLNAGEEDVLLFNVADRDFSPPIVLPDMADRDNRLAVFLMRGEQTILWATIRGDFVVQNVDTGSWERLSSTLGSAGVPVTQVRPFAIGGRALVELADNSAYILDINTDQLIPVLFSG
ncbi:MAG: hypothetical protein JW966_12910 [Anaerolineae bacterium]|nr:hypothetical protein [Anaerolineae bacterium]